MITRTALKRYINRSNRILLAYERKFAKKIRVALLEQLKAYPNQVDTLTPIFEELYMQVGERFYLSQAKLFDDMQKSIFLETFRIWFDIYVKTTIAQKVTNINATTLEKLQEALGDLIPQSLEFEEMVKKLSADFAFSAKRSMMIARTEVGNANNIAKKRSADDRPTEEAMYKIWIHRGAKDPRDWHLALDNGKAIPANQPFLVIDNQGNIEHMDTPHDDHASAGNVINCGCEVLYMTDGFAQRNGYL